MRASALRAGVFVVAAACSHAAPKDRPPEAFEPAPAANAPAAPTDAGSDAAVSAAPSDAGASGLAGFPAQMELLDGGEHLGFVAVPLGAESPRPIVIALHGGSDRPEHACAAWPAAMDGFAFVVCPRGFGGNERRLGWHDPKDTAARIARALAVTKKTFGTWIRETSSVVLAGFSMGGAQVARLAFRDPRRYRRIVIGDSAHDPRPTLTFARAWASGGGERAVFLCSTSGCEPSQRKAARSVAAAKAHARLNVAATQKHALSEPVVESLRRDWAWLVEGAEGWEDFAPAPAALSGRTERYP